MRDHTPEYYAMEKIADGKIACSCGNADWKLFIYIGDAMEKREGWPIAGCKKCAATFEYDSKSGVWNSRMPGFQNYMGMESK